MSEDLLKGTVEVIKCSRLEQEPGEPWNRPERGQTIVAVVEQTIAITTNTTQPYFSSQSIMEDLMHGIMVPDHIEVGGTMILETIGTLKIIKTDAGKLHRNRCLNSTVLHTMLPDITSMHNLPHSCTNLIYFVVLILAIPEFPPFDKEFLLLGAPLKHKSRDLG